MMSNLELVSMMHIRSMNSASISRIEMIQINFFIVYNVDRSDLVFVNQELHLLYLSRPQWSGDYGSFNPKPSFACDQAPFFFGANTLCD